MTDQDNPLGIDLGAIAGALEGLQGAFAAGLDAIGQAEEEAAGDMEPTHEIVVEVELQARVEGHEYAVEATLRYQADLASILSAQMPAGGLADALGELGIDLGSGEGGAILEQLGRPRVVGVLRGVDVEKHVVHSEDGPEDAAPALGSTMLVTLDGSVLRMSFERAFSYPELQSRKVVYCAVPSSTEMEEHVVVEVARMATAVAFGWEEEDKGPLVINGSVAIREL